MNSCTICRGLGERKIAGRWFCNPCGDEYDDYLNMKAEQNATDKARTEAKEGLSASPAVGRGPADME